MIYLANKIKIILLFTRMVTILEGEVYRSNVYIYNKKKRGLNPLFFL